MRKEAQGILKSLPAPPRPFRYSFQLSEILGEEGDDLIGFSVVEGANYNGIRREERHKIIVTLVWTVMIVDIVDTL